MRSGPLHGYAIAQRIHQLSADALRVEEGSLYPALQKILRQGWARAAWGTSETNRRVRFYTLTKDGVKQLEAELRRLRAPDAGHPGRAPAGVMRELLRRLHHLLNRRRFDAELREEMELHRELAARDGGLAAR